MNEAAEAIERVIKREQQKAAVVRALAAWETWIVMASIMYIGAHFGLWAKLGFRVISQ